MEELIEKITKFDGLYKNKDRESDSQEERRKQMLKSQKANRSNVADTFRGVLDLVEAVEESNIFQEERASYRPQIYVAGFTKCAYKDVLMQSEWMIEKPHDFQENWYVVPCPKGIRTLVVANRGRTKLFTRSGNLLRTLQSMLPGGGILGPGRHTGCCVLDGFFTPNTNTVYILDLLAWNDLLMADGETEFRHYWLLTQYEEHPELKEHTKANQIKFEVIPKVPCDPFHFAEFMMHIPHFPNFTPKLDGLLFYHKKAHYVSGVTPLMGWLFPYMVPEVFGPDIPINSAYMLEKPVDYTNQKEFIKKFESRQQKKVRRQRRGSQMDTTPPADSDLVIMETLVESGAFDPDEAGKLDEASGGSME